MLQSSDGGGAVGGYVPAARRRVGRGPGGRARRGKLKDQPKEKEKPFSLNLRGLREEEHQEELKNYRKRQGPRGRMSRPGFKKLKGKYGEMDWNYKLHWNDRVKGSNKEASPKMKLKVKTKKAVPMPSIPSYTEDKERLRKRYISTRRF